MMHTLCNCFPEPKICFFEERNLRNLVLCRVSAWSRGFFSAPGKKLLLLYSYSISYSTSNAGPARDVRGPTQDICGMAQDVRGKSVDKCVGWVELFDPLMRLQYKSDWWKTSPILQLIYLLSFSSIILRIFIIVL